MKKYFLSSLIIFTFLIIPTFVFATTNSGFIPGQIWYSKDSLIEGETVNIHTAVWNGEKNSISVKVEFYDKNVILGTREVTLVSLELKDVFVPWKITSGDHTISAKITSSTATISGKKENVVLDNITTSTDKKSVSVLIKNKEGDIVSGADTVKTQLENTGEKINDLLPENVSDSISEGFVVLEDFRDKKSIQINQIKDETKKEIDLMKSEEKPILDKVTEKTNIEDATKEPITYIKLFLFSTLAFIFSNKIVFYGLLILIAFFILRKIYRLIRNR